MSHETLAVPTMLNENMCVWDQSLSELIWLFIPLCLQFQGSSTPNDTVPLLRWAPRVTLALSPCPHTPTRGVCSPARLPPGKTTEDVTICHQTVPVVPPHLAEDGIALIAPSSLYLAWGKSPFTPCPIRRKAFLFTPSNFKLWSLTGQAGKWWFPRER